MRIAQLQLDVYAAGTCCHNTAFLGSNRYLGLVKLLGLVDDFITDPPLASFLSQS